MNMIIDTTQQAVINFAPASVFEDVEQNVRMILSTMFFSVPYHRSFGLNASYLDSPINQVKIRSIIDITKQINEFEPRVKIEEITYKADPVSGYLNPIVRLSINE